MLTVDKRPTGFFLCGTPWTIDWCSRSDIDDSIGGTVFGETAFGERTIKIATDVPLVEYFNTLLHELQHVIHWSYQFHDPNADGIQFSPSITEEKVATASGNGWAELYIHNPQLARWIGAAATAARRALKTYGHQK
jgi:hypothetical protein